MTPRLSTELEAYRQENPERAAQLEARIKASVRQPHEFQLPVLQAKERFIIVCAGRRFGKTVVAAKRSLREVRQGGRVVWWVANTYKNVVRGYREVLRQIPPGVLTKTPPPASVAASGRLVLHFPGGTRYEFYSAENPDAMAGEGVDYVVGDEAALWKAGVWSQTVRPTLMDARGGGILISTPRGLNWFWKMWTRGQDPLEPDYKSFRFPSSANPYLHPDEIRDMENELPRILFEQEVLAEFVSEAGTIMRLQDDTVRPLAAPHGHLFMGVDLAKHYDFTVLMAGREEDRLPVFYDRFNDVSWPIQKDRIVNAAHKLEAMKGVDGVTVLVDSTGLGDVVFDDLELSDIDVIGIKFTPEQKARMVKLLSADIERGQAFLPDDPKVIAEHQAYTYELTDAGRIKYGAPEGTHDDTVSAKMLEHWGHVHEGAPSVRLTGESNETLVRERDADGNDVIISTAEDITEQVVLRPPSANELMMNPSAWS